jgi:hypothetical protein
MAEPADLEGLIEQHPADIMFAIRLTVALAVDRHWNSPCKDARAQGALDAASSERFQVDLLSL